MYIFTHIHTKREKKERERERDNKKKIFIEQQFEWENGNYLPGLLCVHAKTIKRRVTITQCHKTYSTYNMMTLRNYMSFLHIASHL